MRSALVILGVGFGTALFVSIRIINRSTLKSFKQNVEVVTGKATLTVSAGESGFSEEVLSAIEETPGVSHAIPMVVTRAYLANRGASETVIVLGVDLLREKNVRSYRMADDRVIKDPLSFLNQPDSIILTRSFADKHGITMNRKLELATSMGKSQFVVRGLLSAEGPAQAYGGAVAVMDIDAAQLSFGKRGKLDRVDITLADGESTNTAAERLRTRLGQGYRVDRPETQSEDLERLVASFQVMLSFLSLIALGVGLFLVAISISISVAERRREIGTLRALGAGRWDILTVFMSEAFVFGLVGSAIGLFAGHWMAGFLVRTVSQSMSAQFVMQVEVPKIEGGAVDLQVIVLGVVAACLAALWPSVRATRIPPLEAISSLKQENLREEGGSRLGILPYLGAFILIGSCGASVFLKGKTSSGTQSGFIMLSLMGAALVGPFLVSCFLLLFDFVAARLNAGTVIRLALGNLVRAPKRTAANASVLIVSLSFTVLIGVIHQSFKTTLLDWLDRSLTADLIVSGNGDILSLDVPLMHEDVSREIRAIPGLQLPYSHNLTGLRFMHLGYQGEQIALKAIDEPPTEMGYRGLLTLDRPKEEAGRDLFHAPDPTVLVSENFAHRYHKQNGDGLDLDTPVGRTRFRVAGIMVDYAAPNGVLYMSRDTYKKFWKDPRVNGFSIFLGPGQRASEVRELIDRTLGKSRNLMATMNSEFRSQMNDTIEQSFAFLSSIQTAALLVALLGILNTLLVSVMERTREIGLLRAVGMSRGQTFRMITYEVVLQGLLGATVAVLLGSGIAYVWIGYSLADVLGWVIRFDFPVRLIPNTLALGVFISLLAGLMPARMAVGKQIQEALAYE